MQRGVQQNGPGQYRRWPPGSDHDRRGGGGEPQPDAGVVGDVEVERQVAGRGPEQRAGVGDC